MNIPFARLLTGRSLRPQPRATSLISIANSLGTIASALKIIVLKEYRVDLDAPPPTRADITRDVFEPMYPDNELEAVREEVERISAMEDERGGSHDDTPRRTYALGGMSVGFGHGRGSTDADADELTPEEREFLAELPGAIEDER